MIVYVDSSVVLRLVLEGSGRLREWSRIKHLLTSVLTEVECYRTIDRERIRQGLSDQQVVKIRERTTNVLDTAELIDLGSEVIARAKDAFPTALGTLDALHVSTAIVWRQLREPKLAFATHDHQQATAARAVGFQVVGA